MCATAWGLRCPLYMTTTYLVHLQRHSIVLAEHGNLHHGGFRLRGVARGDSAAAAAGAAVAP